MRLISSNDTEDGDNMYVRPSDGAVFMGSKLLPSDGIEVRRADDTAGPDVPMSSMGNETHLFPHITGGFPASEPHDSHLLSAGHDGDPPFQRSVVALQLLRDARDYARSLGRARWDFAEEIDSLRQHGLTHGDLRWLVCNGFVEHRREVRELDHERRVFHCDKGLSFSRESCFVLTEQGDSYLNRFLSRADNLNDGPRGSPLPVWDRDRQELRVGRIVVKRFRVPARNQETILAAFQEENWPIFIDDPLPMHAEIDPKRRLHDTINSLNRNQKSDLIRFRGNGSGQGIRWEHVGRNNPVINVSV